MTRAGCPGLAFWALVLSAWIAIAPAAHAQVASGAQVGQVATGEVADADAGGTIDRWWGGFGAVLCGLEANLIRTVPAIGMQPALIAAGLGGCILAAMDIMSTK